jgi:VIT1/CCC1 family predicted Fe2+/Mn2+ transporter
MVEQKKENGFMNLLKNVLQSGLNQILQVIAASIFPKIEEGSEIIMKNFDDRIKIIEKRIFNKIFSFVIIGIGGLLLILALFFFLTEYLRWNNTGAFFSIGITFFVTGLLLKLKGLDK